MEPGITEQIRRNSLLIERQRSLGAVIGEAFGWDMALSYGDPKAEHDRVRTDVGLVDLSFCGAIKLGGAEAIPFFNGLITNDVKTLKDGHGMQAAFLTAHGKVSGLCRVLAFDGEYLIINEPQTHEKIYNTLFPFSYAGDFKVSDVSDEYRILSVQGRKALLVMKEVCFEPVPALEAHGWIRTIIAGHETLVVRADRAGEIGYDILAPSTGLADVWDFVLLKGAFHSITPFGLDALNSLRVEAGIPIYGVDVDENNMMLETGLNAAVSLTKGCYKGQEAVAMATYRGHVSKLLSGLILSGDELPSPGARIFKEDKDVGYITSAIRSSTIEKIIALGYVKYGVFDPGTALQVRSESQTLSAVVVALPFYGNN